MIEAEDEDVYPYSQPSQTETSEANPAVVSSTTISDVNNEVLTKLVIQCPLRPKLLQSDYFVTPDPNLMTILQYISDGTLKRRVVSDYNNIFRKAVMELYEKSRSTLFTAVMRLKETNFYLHSSDALRIRVINCPGNLMTTIKQEQLQIELEESVDANKTSFHSTDPVTNSIIIDYICNEFSDTQSAVGHIWSSVGFANGMLQRVQIADKNGYLELNGMIFVDGLKAFIPNDTVVVDYKRLA